MFVKIITASITLVLSSQAFQGPLFKASFTPFSNSASLRILNSSKPSYLFTSIRDIDEGNKKVESSTDSETKSFNGKLMNGMKPKSDKKMSTKEMLAKMGLSTLLSYGFVSNMFMGACVSFSWYTFSRKTGLSPLAPNQWKGFLGTYAAFYVVNNFLRPLRVAASIAISKYFDDAITLIQNKMNCPRAAAIGLVVFLANVVGTLTVMGGGIFIASTLAGVPLFPGK